MSFIYPIVSIPPDMIITETKRIYPNKPLHLVVDHNENVWIFELVVLGKGKNY